MTYLPACHPDAPRLPVIMLDSAGMKASIADLSEEYLELEVESLLEIFDEIYGGWKKPHKNCPCILVPEASYAD